MQPTDRVPVMLFCGKCSCGCPELFVDHSSTSDRRIVITDDFGQQIQMSVDQLRVIVEQATSGALLQAVDAELTRPAA